MIRKFTTIAACFALLLAYGIPGAEASPVVIDRVVAVVNNDVITLSDLQREAAVKKVDIKRDERLLLEDMIDRKLQMAEAKRGGMDVTDKELSDAVADIMKRNSMDSRRFEAALAAEGLTLAQYRDELREQMTLSRMFNKYVRSGVAVQEDEVRSFYEKNMNSYILPEEIRVRQIYFRLPEKATPSQTAAVKEKAEAALSRIRKGEDFIKLVKELSESENAALGGDLGFLQRGQAIPEIEEAAKTLKPGEVAGPLLLAGGYNIIRLEEIRKPVKPFDSIKDEITKMLYEQKVENAYRTWLQALRSDSHIENRL